jgi:hypothetical protein
MDAHRCCHCCTHSIGNSGGLWCALIDGPATSACASWAREPGADCEEKSGEYSSARQLVKVSITSGSKSEQR